MYVWILEHFYLDFISNQCFYINISKTDLIVYTDVSELTPNVGKTHITEDSVTTQTNRLTSTHPR